MTQQSQQDDEVLAAQKGLLERAAELLSDVVGDLLDEKSIKWEDWQLKAQQWLRDAGVERK